MKRVGIGVIGCGTISGAYLTAARVFPLLEVCALADTDQKAAEERAREFGLTARSVDDALADPAIEIIVNLTVPEAHVEVGLRALAAGKHTYSEKPLAIDVADGARLLAASAERNLRVGCAPDTFWAAPIRPCAS